MISTCGNTSMAMVTTLMKTFGQLPSLKGCLLQSLQNEHYLYCYLVAVDSGARGRSVIPGWQGVWQIDSGNVHSQGPAEWVHNKLWPLWWQILLSMRVQTTLNQCWFVFTTLSSSNKTILSPHDTLHENFDASIILCSLIHSGNGPITLLPYCQM